MHRALISFEMTVSLFCFVFFYLYSCIFSRRLFLFFGASSPAFWIFFILAYPSVSFLFICVQVPW